MSSPSVLMISLLIKKRAEICEVFLFDVRFGGMSVWEVCRHNRSSSKTPATHTQYLTLISDKRNHSQIKQKKNFPRLQFPRISEHRKKNNLIPIGHVQGAQLIR